MGKNEEKGSDLINLKGIKNLVKMLTKNNLQKFSLRQNGTTITIIWPHQFEFRRIPVEFTQPPIVQKLEVTEGKLVEVKSPDVGIVHLSPTPDQLPLVEKNQKVKKGEILCLIDTRVLYEFDQVKSPCNGTIEAIKVEEGQVVDFGTLLFIIQPEEEKEERSESDKTQET